MMKIEYKTRTVIYEQSIHGYTILLSDFFGGSYVQLDPSQRRFFLELSRSSRLLPLRNLSDAKG